MTTIYTICLIIGVTVPLLSILCDFFDGVGDFFDLDFDFPELPIGDFHIALLPISANSICGGLLLFGTLGLILQKATALELLIINIIAIAGGYFTGIMIQTMINKLKKVENPAMKEEELLLFDAMVINAIPEKSMGSISIEIPGSSSVSYPAKAMDGDRINQNKQVIIDHFEKGIAFVRPIDYLEKKYEKMIEEEKIEK